MKNKIVAANWKLQKTPQQALEFSQKLKLKLSQNTMLSQKADLFIFPQNFSLHTVCEEFKNTQILCGPQNIHTELKGAFTGENSAEIAQMMGSKLVLLGHSERRQYFHENSKDLHAKINICQKLNLLPVYCIGESLAEREANQTNDVCKKQLQEVLMTVDKSQKIIIAYEPVWAIGTGKVATLEQVKEMHQFIFSVMQEMEFKDFSLLYGGSVKADNANALSQIDHVDGFLVGGASLEVDSFLEIVMSL